MTVRDLRAVLENIIDTLEVFIVRDEQYVELREEDLKIVTLDAGKYIGPTVLVIAEDDEY